MIKLKRRKFCECGCGKMIRPESKYARGHNLLNYWRDPVNRERQSHRVSARRGELASHWQGGEINLVCEVCGFSFSVSKGRKDTTRFCSSKCQNEWLKTLTGEKRYNFAKVRLRCDQCGKIMDRSPSSIKEQNFCDQVCHYKWNSENLVGENNPGYKRVETNCAYCGVELKLNPTRLKTMTGVNFCSVNCMAKYNAEDKERCKKISGTVKRLHQEGIYTEEIHKKQGKALSKRFENPEFKKKWFDERDFCILPNKLELRVQRWLDKLFPKEWKYVGDFQTFIGGKCPDFMNVNGQKKLIEVFGDYWHQDDDPQKRIDHFSEYGFETLVLWERGINSNPKKAKEAIMDFYSC